MSSGRIEKVLDNKCLCNANLKLIVDRKQKFNPASGPMVFGPGGDRQWYTAETKKIICTGCAILYDHESFNVSTEGLGLTEDDDSTISDEAIKDIERHLFGEKE